MTVDGSTSVRGEVSQNGLSHLTGLPSSGGTVSLSPDAAVKDTDTTNLSRTSHATSLMSRTGLISGCQLICNYGQETVTFLS